jgi:hypothetical protein
LKQGEDYQVDVLIRDDRGAAIDTTGWSATAQIRNLEGGLVASFGLSFPAVGTARFALSALISGGMAPGRYLYDAKFIASTGQTRYYLEGDVLVAQAVTR